MHFSEAMLFTPGHLRAVDPKAPSLQAAAGGPEAWPSLRRLRGRFLFVLTGPKVRLEHYRKSGEDPVAFIAPRIARASEIETHRHAVFFNLADAKARRSAGRKLLRRGLVSRSYGLDTRETWRHAAGASIHHLATDMVNDREHRWASTRDGSAPFQII